MIMLLFCLLFAATIAWALWYIYLQSKIIFIARSSTIRVLFVTAHPDDECMFFAPTIQHFLARGIKVYLLCLSVGDFYGNGSTRVMELKSSAAVLGINLENLFIVNKTGMPDHPHVEWDMRLIAELIIEKVVGLHINGIVSFDQYGVSGHRNHVSICRALEYFSNAKKAQRVRIFTLQSVNTVIKYTSFFSLMLLPLYKHTTRIVSNPKQVWSTWHAMAAHSSQLTWFRILYILFSQYVIVNVLHEMHKQSEIVKTDNDLKKDY